MSLGQDLQTPAATIEFQTDLDVILDFNVPKDGVETDSIEVRWRRPVANLTHYLLEVEDASQDAYNQKGPVEIEKTATSYTVENLDPATKYRIILKPYKGSVTCEKCFGITKPVRTKIPEPQNVKFEVLTPNYIALTWDSVASASYYVVSKTMTKKINLVFIVCGIKILNFVIIHKNLGR